MILTKELMFGITLTTLCLPAFCNTTEASLDQKQQLAFLSFLAFVGSVSEMESAGIDVDELLETETDE